MGPRVYPNSYVILSFGLNVFLFKRTPNCIGVLRGLQFNMLKSCWGTPKLVVLIIG
jgi:hypothetical protein